ncbi:hypothetical protein KJ909_00870, partial [Patescibacteria group bacterium]|nr:hypothetical protein [Patescibacteria group bacterium]
FDTKKSGLSLIWEQNRDKYSSFTTLDGSKLKLGPETLMVNSPKKALSLSFLGGQSSAIQKNSTDIIIEMAVYHPSRVRQDSRFLKTSTEAGIRLDKFLDPELIPPAFSSLVYLILKHCGGQINSQLFSYYPQKIKTQKILFRPQLVSSFAGINIPTPFCLTILKKIGCLVEKNKKAYLVTPPSLRPDIRLEEDLIEEVIRYFGYEKIPTNEVLSQKDSPDITPSLVSLICTLQNILTSFGYDEIRSWPLVNQKMIVDPKTVIYTQNSINSKYPALRQSIIPSLINQKKQYSRFKLENQQFFEIGKIYYQEKKGDYQEKYSLAFHHPNSVQLQKNLDKLLAYFHLNQDLLMNPLLLSKQKNDSYVEIILDNLVHQISPQDLCLDFSTKKYTAYELERQIITLDANLNFKSKKDPKKILKKYVKILKDKLWQIKITDIYFDQKTQKYRYTLQVSYFALNDKSAKKLHLKTFNLG